MAIRLILVITILFYSVALQAQKGNNNSTGKPQANLPPHVSNTVVIKIKPEYRDFIENKPNAHASFNKLFKAGIVSLERTFPGLDAPVEKKDRYGRELPDLTLIYTIVYAGNLKVEDALPYLYKTGMIEYAEPKFTDEVLYVPNDPYAQPGLPSSEMSQFYLEWIKAYEAWDIEKGDTNVVIGIVDTGVRLDHEDLSENIKYNYADPIDGIDNDGDGYIDNFHGWDIANNDNDPSAVHGHGALVSGCASATTDNNLGLTGTGFRCKFLPVKAATDASGGAITHGYTGLLYAANKNCKIINLSWGGASSFSQTSQDVINYAALVKDALIISAAGNTNAELDFFPASYDHVLSVAASDTAYSPSAGRLIDIKVGYGTYSHLVDICAQGRDVVSTRNIGSAEYGAFNGSSFSAPLVAGAAGLVRSRYPGLSALQAAELLRVTADVIDTFPETMPYKEMLGKGRLNMYRALTDNISPAIRMLSSDLRNQYGSLAFSDDTVTMHCDFINYLQPSSSDLKIQLSPVSPYVTVLDSIFTAGAMNTLETKDNTGEVFRIYIHPDVPANHRVKFRLGFTDETKEYYDYQYFYKTVNPSYLTIDTNQITTTVTSKGRIGFNDANTQTGDGFVYNNKYMLFEAGLILAQSSTKVSDCVRGNGWDFENNFTPLENVRYVPPVKSQEETSAVFQDTSDAGVKVKVSQKSFGWTAPQDDKYVIIEYKLKNVTATPVDTLYAGIFADWDILHDDPNDYNRNRANWDTEDKVGYVYNTKANGLYAGIALLTKENPTCYSLDNGPVGGDNINPNDGFTKAEKHATLANGIGRMQAGTGPTGYDVSHVIGAEIYNLQPGEIRTIAFALIAADDLYDLKMRTRRAKEKYISVNQGPVPSVSNYTLCPGDTSDFLIAPPNGQTFSFYNELLPASPVHQGNSYLIEDVYEADTFYVTNADSLFESNPAIVSIHVSNAINADFHILPDTIRLSEGNTAWFVNNSSGAGSILWDFGGGETSTSSFVSRNYTLPGIYPVLLTATGNDGCTDTITKNLIVEQVTSNEPINESDIRIFPNPTSESVNIEFSLKNLHKVSLSIMNVLGEALYNTDSIVKDDTIRIDMSAFPQGIYFIRITAGSKTFVKRLIKT